MLVSRLVPRSDDADRGSTIVVVLVIMLVLSIGALALGAIVVNTTVGLDRSRDTAASRAAADAGIAAAVAQARRTGDFCSLDLRNRPDQPGYVAADPDYTVTSACADGKVTFSATGFGKTGGETDTQSVYSTIAAANLAGSAELVFFNSGSDSVYFTNHVMPASSTLATILFPGGGLFECKTTVPGNVITKGSIQGQSGCTINGSVFAGGQNPVGNGGSATALYLNNDDRVLGGAAVVGNVLIGNAPAGIGGTLTVPSTATVTSRWGTTVKSPTTQDASVNGGKAGGIIWSTTLGAPVMDPWFEYQPKAGDWPGYDTVTITPTSSPYNCGNINTYDTTFWSTLVTGLAKNTVIDTLACSAGIQTGSISSAGDKPRLGADMVLLAQSFTLGDFSLTPKAGTTPSAWFVVPDTSSADGRPTCPASGYHGIQTDASISITVKSMMYTPCTIRVGQGGTWTGAMYAGSLDDGGDITIYTASMALPGQWGAGAGGSGTPSSATSMTLGGLLSQRDVP